MNNIGEEKKKNCPFCAELIMADAIKCKHCGEWLKSDAIDGEKKSYGEAISYGASYGVSETYSNGQQIWQLILLSFLSFGLYAIYWFYRTWRQLKESKDLDISPGWRTLGLLVPILNFVLIYELFRDIKKYAQDLGCKAHSSPGWIVLGYCILNAASFKILSIADKLADPGQRLIIFLISEVFSLLAILLIVKVQTTLNAYWTELQSGLIVRPKFSKGEIVFLILSGIVWVLCMIGTMLPD
jgi:hypothetical protein